MERFPLVPSAGLVASDAETRLSVTWAGARDGLWDWNLVSGEIRFSPRWKELLGHAPDELLDKPEEWFRRVHPKDLDALKQAIEAHITGKTPCIDREFRILHKDGQWRRILCSGRVSEDRAMLGGSFSDVTEARAAEGHLLIEAFHDRLTGLPNRSLFLDRLRLALSRSRLRSGTLAVLYLDLDRFRTINESLGSQHGDTLLVELTERMRQLLRPGDTLARVGGDKFAYLLDGVGGPRAAVRFAEEIANALLAPLFLGGQEVFATASVGVALAGSGSGEGRCRSEDLFNDAISAMHKAKETGTHLELFDPEQSRLAKDRLRLEADLRHAVERGEFQLHYQPIVSFGDGTLTGFEALLRWSHPERGFVSPDAFIPIAEENGMIIPLGNWVLEEACRQMVEWRETFPAQKDISVAVNLSARQFESPGLVGEVASTLGRTGLEPSGLKLEMTESVVMARTRENAARLQSLRDLGVRLLIDDFGTGYSSLASLTSFPLDTLKIDRSFVNGMEFEREKSEIVRTILTLARNLNLDVVAEGVETAEQLEMLRSLECPHGQGYYFSAAVDSDSAAAWLRDAPTW